jgi:CheY-like chemotaxis protein
VATGEPATIAGTVLVIEDESLLRTAVSKMLRSKGYIVVEAEDGTAGVDRFLTNRQAVDAVLLDLTLPGKSGREVLSEIQSIQPGAKVIVTSAYGLERVQKSLDGLNSWVYVQKPYQIAKLETLLQDAIGGAARRACRVN